MGRVVWAPIHGANQSSILITTEKEYNLLTVLSVKPADRQTDTAQTSDDIRLGTRRRRWQHQQSYDDHGEHC